MLTLHTVLRRVLAQLQSQGLSEDDAASLRFLVQAQALYQACATNQEAQVRWAALSRLSGAHRDASRDSRELHKRLSAATAAALNLGNQGTLSPPAGCHTWVAVCCFPVATPASYAMLGSRQHVSVVSVVHI